MEYLYLPVPLRRLAAETGKEKTMSSFRLFKIVILCVSVGSMLVLLGGCVPEENQKETLTNLDDVNKELTRVKSDLGKARLGQEEAEKRETAARDDLKKAKNELAKLKTQNARLRNELDKAKAAAGESSDSGRDIKKLKDDLKVAKDENAQLRKKVDEQLATIFQQEKKIKKLEETQESLQKAIMQLQMGGRGASLGPPPAPKKK
jgi:uncharacterized protein (DUF3084 family)